MRRGVKWAIAVAATGVVVLGALEWRRRAGLELDDMPGGQLSTPDRSASVPGAIDPDELVRQFRAPDRFALLCRRLREETIAIGDRHQTLDHAEINRAVEFDPKGAEIATETKLERVWFEGTKEFRQTFRAGDGWEPITEPKVSEPGKVCFPFTREADEGAYRVTLEGHETQTGRLTLVLAFEPNPPVDTKFRGKIWVDPDTFEPARVDCVAAKNPPFVDRVSMVFEYGPAENNKTQARRSIIGGSGGFAFVQKKYAVHTDLFDFRPHAAAANDPTPERIPSTVSAPAPATPSDRVARP